MVSRDQRYTRKSNEERRRESRNPYKLAAAIEVISYAEREMLESKLSPDAICGREAIECRFPVRVCTKTLYNYIAAGLVKVKNVDLLLRVKRKPTKRHEAHKSKRFCMAKALKIVPLILKSVRKPGIGRLTPLWGKRETKEVLLMLDERKTRKLLVVKIPSRTASAVREGLRTLLSPLGDRISEVFNSITSDNGSEFASLPDILPHTAIYYAHPYSSFERGTNENQNSLIRRFFPKGTDFALVSDDALRRVQLWVNSLSRAKFTLIVLLIFSFSLLFLTVRFDIAIQLLYIQKPVSTIFP